MDKFKAFLNALLIEPLFRKLWISWRDGIEATAIPGSGGIVFLGDSITHNGRWDLIFPSSAARNFGINGERTDQVLTRLAPLISIKPTKVFLLIGTNDLGQGIDQDTIVDNVGKILDQLAAALPDCKIHLQTVVPRAARFASRIKSLNARYAEIAQQRGVTLIDLFPVFDNGKGQMRKELTYDDLHLNGAGYVAWRDTLQPHVSAAE